MASLVIFSKLVYCSNFSDERLVQLAQRLWKHVDSASTVPVIVKVRIYSGWVGLTVAHTCSCKPLRCSGDRANTLSTCIVDIHHTCIPILHTWVPTTWASVHRGAVWGQCGVCCSEPNPVHRVDLVRMGFFGLSSCCLVITRSTGHLLSVFAPGFTLMTSQDTGVQRH